MAMRHPEQQQQKNGQRAKSEDPRKAEKKPSENEKPLSPPGRETEMRNKPDHGEESYEGKGRLEGKVALITGGDSGIGRAVAIAFAREGADVAIAYLNEDDDAKETIAWVEKAGKRGLAIRADLAEGKECERVIDETVKAFGRIDVLVNNAAMQRKAVEKFEDIDLDEMERTFKTNIIAMFHLVHHALPHMKEGSSIINTSSIQAYKPSANILDYATTKGAIVTFTKGLAQELIKRGIRVNTVAPGPVWTPLVAQSFDEEKLSKFGEQSPMERPAQPKELAPSFVFFASEEGQYVNGEVLGVTGGMLLG